MRLIDADLLLFNLAGTMEASPTGYIHGNTVADMIHDVPTAEPERKTGKWIPYLGFSCPWECSECSTFQGDVSWYCPNCGAKMEVQND